MDRSRLLRRSLLAALWLPAACGMLPPPDLKSPKLDISDLSVLKLGLSELRFGLTLRADNPNDVDLPLSNLRFDLELLEQPFATGVVTESKVVIPRRGTKDVPVEFTVPTSRLLDLLKQVPRSDFAKLSYRLRGGAAWGWSGFPLSFEKRGDLDALRSLRELIGR